MICKNCNWAFMDLHHKYCAICGHPVDKKLIEVKRMNCKTCIWGRKELFKKRWVCLCDHEEYDEDELFDCNEHDMEVEIEPK